MATYNFGMSELEMPRPLVGVVMGSKSDYAVMAAAVEMLREFGVAHEVRVVSAHRTPDLLFEYAASAERRGLRAIIAGAGGAAHLPGMLAAKTLVPVLGVPVPATSLQGMDSLLSIVQMPKGVPVATFAIGRAGAANAGLFAVQMLARSDEGLREKLAAGGRRARLRCWFSRWARTPSRSCRSEPVRSEAGGGAGRAAGDSGRRAAGPDDGDGGASMGYRVRVMDPEAGCPASFVVDEVVTGKWDDVEAAARLAQGADAVTLEIEQIGIDALRTVAALAPLRPGVEPIRIIQDKILQKEWLAANDFPVGPFRVVRSEASCMRL